MNPFFSTQQEAIMEHLRVLKHFVAEQELRSAPCKLLVSQLEELKVFTNKLNSVTVKMLNELNKDA